jgi:outer membrane receptor protein involved in Fe transport
LSFIDKGPGQTQLAIRGITTGLQQDIGTDSTVGVYIDEIPVSVSQAQPDLKLFDLNRIEVLRGPQGTLYGSGSLGGTIRLITNQPDLIDYSGKAEITGSGTEHGGPNVGINALANLPIIQDELGARITLYGRNNSGWIDDIARDKNGVNEEHTAGGRASFRYQPLKDLNITFSAIFQNSRFGELNAYDPGLGDLKIARAGPETFIDHLQIYNLAATYDFGWSSLVSSSSYTQRRYDYVRDYSALYGATALSPIGYSVEGVTQEIRLSSPNRDSDRFKWLIGAFYSHRNDGYDQSIPVNGSGPSPLGEDVTFAGASDLKVDQSALFGEASYEIVPRLTLTGGLRYYNAHEDSSSISQSPVPPPQNLSILAGTQTFNGSKSTPKASLSFKLDQGTQIYVQAAEGYRIGGANRIIAPIPGQPTDPLTFGPDTLWNYELGLKGDWLDHRLNFTAAVFDIEWKDVQIQLTDVAGNAYYTNAGNARSRGGEFQVSALVLPGLRVDATGSWTDAREKQAVPNVGAFQGSRLPDVPKFSGSFAMEYDHKIAGMDAFARGDITYTGASHAVFEELPQGNFFLSSLRTGLDFGRYQVELFIDNIADRRPVVLNFPFPYDSVYTVTPRTAGVTLRANF